MKEESAFDRRDFLKISGGAAVSIAVLGCGTSESVELTRALFEVGSVTGFTEGIINYFDGGPFFVLRDEDGLYALAALCTHQGCVVEAGSDRFSCPCHDSTFDFDGAVTQGPATAPLVHFLVAVEGGQVSVDTRVEVSASERVVV